MSFFGIGSGSMDLRLNKNSFYPKESIEGTATMHLNGEVKARGIAARFWAERTESRYRNGRSGSHTVILFEDSRQLDTERNYTIRDSGKPYPFSFTVPDGILAAPVSGQGVINGLMNTFRSWGNNNVRWKIEVKLDIPMAFDISKTQAISVFPPPASMASAMRN